MILFVAPNPFKEKKREGFLQRVAAIDAVFTNEEKIYFDDLDTDKAIIAALVKAKMIYVHSIYMAEKIIYLYPLLGHKIITDFHGVVPEEESYLGNMNRAKQLAKVEKNVIKYGKYFVTVTNAMQHHFIGRYHINNEAEWITLPIFDLHGATDLGNKLVTNTVIYAGGTQRWQNIDEMINIINETKDKYAYNILTHNQEAFKAIIDKEVLIKSVTSDKVKDYYLNSTYGFVLRSDNIVNRVACPTKLIEYLEYGIIPITDVAEIGDFEELGYRSISIEQFTNNRISKEEIYSMRQINIGVLDKLKNVTLDGTNKLKNISVVLNKASVKDLVDNVGIYLDASHDRESATNILKYQDEIKHLQSKIKEYATAVDYLKHELEEIRTQKPRKVFYKKNTKIRGHN